MFRTHAARWAVAAVAIATAAVMAAPAANAAPRSSGAFPAPSAGKHVMFPAGSVPAGHGGAGYVAQQLTSFSSASTTLTVPTITCASDQDSEYLLPGIWLIAPPFDVYSASVGAGCFDGTPAYVALLCLPETSCDSSTLIAPGDRIQLTVTSSANAVGLVFTDVTSGQTYTQAATPLSGPPITFIGAFDPDFYGSETVPSFSAVQFTKSMINGVDLRTAGAQRFNLKDNTDIQIAASPLSPNGMGFYARFRRNT